MINVQNIDDNECFKWSLVRYLNLADDLPARITKSDKDFAKKLDFKGIKFPVKVRDIHKVEKNNSVGISVFGYENKEKKSNLCTKKLLQRKTCWFIINMKGRKEKLYSYQRFWNVWRFWDFDHSLHRGKKHFYRYCLQDFSTEEILKGYIKDRFKINSKQMIIMPKKGEYVTFKNDERKIKSPSMIYADFESIIMPADNGKQNSIQANIIS